MGGEKLLFTGKTPGGKSCVTDFVYKAETGVFSVSYHEDRKLKARYRLHLGCIDTVNSLDGVVQVNMRNYWDNSIRTVEIPVAGESPLSSRFAGLRLAMAFRERLSEKKKYEAEIRHAKELNRRFEEECGFGLDELQRQTGFLYRGFYEGQELYFHIAKKAIISFLPDSLMELTYIGAVPREDEVKALRKLTFPTTDVLFVLYFPTDEKCDAFFQEVKKNRLDFPRHYPGPLPAGYGYAQISMSDDSPITSFAALVSRTKDEKRPSAAALQELCDFATYEYFLLTNGIEPGDFEFVPFFEGHRLDMHGNL